MSYNIATCPTEQRDKINVDLHASGVAYKERYGMPFNLADIEAEIPKALKEYFQQRITFYRSNPYQLNKLTYIAKARK